MAILDEVKTDLHGAMRAGEKDKVGALRLVLSELQKAAKDGSDDELAVLRRERKRRLEAAQAYRDAGQADRANGEEAEGELIAGYLPPELSDAELKEIVEQAVRRQRGGVGEGHGCRDGQGDGCCRRSRRWQARIGARARRTQRMSAPDG